MSPTPTQTTKNTLLLLLLLLGIVIAFPVVGTLERAGQGNLSALSAASDSLSSSRVSSFLQTTKGKDSIVSRLTRINQLDCSQYASAEECATWSPSTCSAAAMTEIVNATLGKHDHLTDILAVESRAGEITPAEGILHDAGFAHTLSAFRLYTTWGHQWSLDQIVAIANAGTPVIVSFPPPHWGHILVVRGGDASSVFLVDSSSYHLTALSRSRFLYYWQGFAAIAVSYSPADYARVAREDAHAAGITEGVFVRQIKQESGFQPWVVSPAGAIGIAQFEPQTARGIGLDPWNPLESLVAAAHYMAQKLHVYSGDEEKALAAYNAGDGAVSQAVSQAGQNWLSVMPGETQNYVHSILS